MIGSSVDIFADALAALGLSAAHAEQLHKFLVLFRKWNTSINLSAARDDAEIAEHIIDSLHVVPHLQTAGSDSPRVLDVGSGGGFPCVVAAICLADAQITALEPVHKKHAFLRTASRDLRLPNLEPLATRLDAHPARDYGAATSRATFDLRDWLQLGLPYVGTGVVLGFEGVPRDDLPAGTTRHPYALNNKLRAIVALRGRAVLPCG